MLLSMPTNIQVEESRYDLCCYVFHELSVAPSLRHPTHTNPSRSTRVWFLSCVLCWHSGWHSLSNLFIYIYYSLWGSSLIAVLDSLQWTSCLNCYHDMWDWNKFTTDGGHRTQSIFFACHVLQVNFSIQIIC